MFEPDCSLLPFRGLVLKPMLAWTSEAELLCY